MLSHGSVILNTVDENSLEENIHVTPVIWPSPTITQCRAIQPKIDDGNIAFQDVQEWQHNNLIIRKIVVKLFGDEAMFDHLRKLRMLHEKLLHDHP